MLIKIELIHPVNSQKVGTIAVTKMEVKAKACPKRIVIVTQLPKEFRLKKIEVGIGLDRLVGAQYRPPHKVSIQGLFIVHTLCKTIAFKIISRAILEGRVTVVDNRSEDTSGILSIARLRERDNTHKA